MKAIRILLRITGCGLISLTTALAQIPTTMAIQPAAQITWQAESNRVYQVQRSPDMSPGSWTDINEPFLGDRVTNYVALTGKSAAFYRVMTLLQPLVTDPPNNLTGDPFIDPNGDPNGDPTRGFMDIMGFTALPEGTNYAFTMQVATPFPSPSVMTNKRVDYIFFVDADRNQSTGQSSDGNDYNVHLFLQNDGWGAWWGKVTPASENDGIDIDYSKFQLRIAGDRAALVFPRYFLPTNSFEMYMVSHNGVVTNWIPFTQHPKTARGVFEY